MRKKYLFISAILTVVMMSAVIPAGAATNPPQPNVIKNALAGKEYQQAVTLSNNSGESALYILAARGSIGSMTKFYSEADPKTAITELTIPGKSTAKLIIKYAIPVGQATGDHEGAIAISRRGQGEEQAKLATSTLPSAVQEVRISVTDKKILDLTAVISPVSAEVTRGDDINFRVSYNNRGNVAVKPEINLAISQDNAVVYSEVKTLPETVKVIWPLEKKELPLLAVASKDYRPGNIKADITVSNNGKVLGARSFDIKIMPRYQAYFSAARDYWYIFILIGLLLTLQTAVLLYKNRLKWKKNKNIFQVP